MFYTLTTSEQATVRRMEQRIEASREKIPLCECGSTALPCGVCYEYFGAEAERLRDINPVETLTLNR